MARTFAEQLEILREQVQELVPEQEVKQVQEAASQNSQWKTHHGVTPLTFPELWKDQLMQQALRESQKQTAPSLPHGTYSPSKPPSVVISSSMTFAVRLLDSTPPMYAIIGPNDRTILCANAAEVVDRVKELLFLYENGSL